MIVENSSLASARGLTVEPPRMPDACYETWPSLPVRYGTNVGPMRWKRGRSWGRNGIAFARPAAVPVAVTPAAAALLAELDAAVSTVWASVHEAVIKEWSSGVAHTRLGAGMQEPLEKAMQARGIDPGSAAWHTRGRAARSAVILFRKQAGKDTRPFMPSPGPLPCVRLAAGAVHGHPVGYEAGAATGIVQVLPIDILTLHELGRVLMLRPLAGTRPVTDAAYVEAAHWDRRWWMRFVFVREREKA